MEERWEPGRLVVSTTGRDKGKLYLTLGKDQDSRVYVADGESRKVLNPKRKNEKHLRLLPEISSDINEKVKSGLKVTDLDVQRALKEIINHYLSLSADNRDRESFIEGSEKLKGYHEG